MRALVPTLAILLVAGCASSPEVAKGGEQTVDTAKLGKAAVALEEKSGGRLGIAVTDAAGKLLYGHRADERFAMCSTFKLLLAGQVLQAATSGVSLREPLDFTRADLLPNSPASEKLIGADGKGQHRIGFAAEDAVVYSDNSAANLLLKRFGGPVAFTERVRATGDKVTQLDRLEPGLNQNDPSDPRDTTSPAAMARSAAGYVFGERLHPDYRKMLREWMVRSETGRDRIRAGLPAGWRAGDKTGTCNSAYNDVAFAETPAGGQYMIAVYFDRPALKGAAANAILADVARAIAPELPE